MCIDAQTVITGNNTIMINLNIQICDRIKWFSSDWDILQ